MHLGVGDYYSLSSGNYKKHAQVEVIGVDSLQPYSAGSQPMPSYSSQRKIKESVIKEEQQMEYEKQQEINNKLYRTTKLKDRQDATSQYGKEQPEDRNYLVYSYIDKKNKGAPLKRLDEIHRSISQSAESNNEQKQLYLELEKEKKMRMDLEKSYRTLLGQVNQRSTEPTLRRKKSDKTVGGEKANHTQEEQYYESANNSRVTDRKTVKMSQYQTPRNIPRQSDFQEEEQMVRIDPIQIKQNQESSDTEDCYRRRTVITQESAQFLEDYMTEQREFQARMIDVVENLHKKVEELDEYLFAKEQAEKEAEFERQLAQKQNKIKKMQEQNELLRTQAVKDEKQEKDNPRDILTNLSPNSLYFFCIILMAIIAVA